MIRPQGKEVHQVGGGKPGGEFFGHVAFGEDDLRGAERAQDSGVFIGDGLDHHFLGAQLLEVEHGEDGVVHGGPHPHDHHVGGGHVERVQGFAVGGVGGDGLGTVVLDLLDGGGVAVNGQHLAAAFIQFAREVEAEAAQPDDDVAFLVHASSRQLIVISSSA